MATRVIWLVVVAVVVTASDASAHGMRTAYLELEVRGTMTTARFRAPASARTAPIVDGCPLAPLGSTIATDSGELLTYTAPCGSLIGVTLGVAGLGGELDEAVVIVRDELGREHSTVLTRASPTYVVPGTTSAWSTALGYVGHGARHIATGVDHMLLLLLLVLQLRRLRPILVVESAFSLSHGLAFAATALGWIEIDPAPVEACIALSLLLVALDVGDRPGSTRSLALLALAFGLIHGLGFAGGLRELGIPSDHAAAAVIGFGLGVELGQIGFVVIAWVSLAAVRALGLEHKLSVVVTLGAGAVATFWLIDRVRSVMEGT